MRVACGRWKLGGVPPDSSNGRKSLSWETLDWRILDRLRERFLEGGEPGGASYWTSWSDLANYDFTYAQRIGWKWDAVLRELTLRGWRPPAGPVLDWGCGSGIAGRRIVAHYGAEHFGTLGVQDRSPLAVAFAAGAAREQFPGLPVQTLEASPQAAYATLVVSHVLNELDDAGRASLRAQIDRAAAVLWVEPGTFADSRALIACREELLADFDVIAPCTHRNRCGMLNAHNARHWCHHFATPPADLLGDARWVQFARDAEIDLRSIPYSFLVLERRASRPDAGQYLCEGGWSRLIGRPRVYKGYAKILDCSAEDVNDIPVQQRDNPDVFRALKKGHDPTLLRVRAGVKEWRLIDEARP